MRAMTGPATGDFQIPGVDRAPAPGRRPVGIPTLTETSVSANLPSGVRAVLHGGLRRIRNGLRSPRECAGCAPFNGSGPVRWFPPDRAGPGPVDHHRALHGPTPRCRGSPGADRCDGPYRWDAWSSASVTSPPRRHAARRRWRGWSRSAATVALLRRAHPHPGEPARRRTPGGGELPRSTGTRYDLFVALTAARCATTPAAGRQRHLPRRRARPDHHRQGGRERRPPLRRALRVRRRRGLEPRGDAQPRHRPARRGWRSLRERVEAMKAIWTQDEASYHGEFVNFDRIWSWPKPAQRPHPPVLVGGIGPTVLDRVLAFGDALVPELGTRTSSTGSPSCAPAPTARRGPGDERARGPARCSSSSARRASVASSRWLPSGPARRVEQAIRGVGVRDRRPARRVGARTTGRAASDHRPGRRACSCG